jgi:hypothetical protein
MYSSGEINFEDYVRALNIIRKSGVSSELVARVDSTLTNLLVRSLTDPSIGLLSGLDSLPQLLESGLAREALGSMLRFLEREPEANEGVIEALNNLISGASVLLSSTSGLRFPSLGVGLVLPTIGFSVGFPTSSALLILTFSAVLVVFLLMRGGSRQP